MRTGAKRLYLVVQRPTDATDEYGQVSQTWGDFANVRGCSGPLNGRETIRGEKVSADVTHRVFIRYVDGIKPKMRLSDGSTGIVYNIVSIADRRDRRAELELMCRETV